MPSEPKTPEQKLRRYLRHMADLRPDAAAEVSFYPALGELLNAVGGELKPKVGAKLLPRQSGEGQPDFGLYTADQTRRGRKNPAAANPEKPARGVVEVKGLAADLDDLVHSEQVGKYLRGYGLVLATNFRGFALVERDRENGKPVVLESRQIAQSEGDFWRGHSAIPGQHGPALCEFLARAMTHAAPISRAEDVANLLASYAREAADTLEKRDASALKPLRDALEASLGIKFEGGDGDHFFRSTLVQTVFYGLFSAWMESNGEKFDWKSAAFAVKTPVIRALFHAIINPNLVGNLGLRESLDFASNGLNRVENKGELLGGMGVFEVIQHFYEPFLAAFDPKLRKELGVWYTPPEVVRYMVRRVDSVLKSELHVPDGLAADNVRVLDPCVGTGAYLAETLRVIRQTLTRRDGEKMAALGVKQAAQRRVFGFEILPASFVVAHWQIGALLAEAGAPMKNGERAAVYLTNSLTGWELEESSDIPFFGELAEERKAAGKVKRDEPILVVIGNPPYNAFTGTSPAEEGELVEPYKEGLVKKWKTMKFNLDDLYVRFIRVAERRIAKNGRGVVCYISNHSYITEPSFVVMRQKLLREFDSVWIDNLNGNIRAGGKTPDGLPDASVFSTESNKAGIKVGTAVGLYVRKEGRENREGMATVRHRDFWGRNKRGELEESLKAPDFDSAYQFPDLREYNRFSFRPMNVGGDYLRWPLASELCREYFDGMDECRKGALVDIHRESLEERMRRYFDAGVKWPEYQAGGGGLAKDAARFNAQTARQRALAAGLGSGEIARHAMRPMDNGFCYYTGVRPIWNEPRPKLRMQATVDNLFFLSRKSAVVGNEGVPMFFTRAVADRGLLRGLARHIPVWLVQEETVGKRKVSPNLSEATLAYLEGLGFSGKDLGKPGNPDGGDQVQPAELPLMHALAVVYSPEYRRQNADGLRIDWPRIPMPQGREGLENSAALGRKVSRLLDADSRLAGVDEGEIPARLRMLSVLDCDGEPDFSVRGWGRAGGGKVSAGRGRLEHRDWRAAEAAELDARALELLGGALDVYLNDGTFWSGVPEAAWDFRIGGYPVARKWLSYRAESVLGRALREDEARHFTAMIRRLSALVLLTDELDANYRAARDSAGKWGM